MVDRSIKRAFGLVVKSFGAAAVCGIDPSSAFRLNRVMGDRPLPDAFAAYSYRADPAVPAFPDDRPIFIFDGECALCSGFLRFLLKHDTHKCFRLLAAQSALGAALYAHCGKKPGDFETHMLIENGIASFKSDAAIRVFAIIGLPWSLIAVTRIAPRALRDGLYDRVARNRIAWFGARACYAPSPSDAERFLA